MQYNQTNNPTFIQPATTYYAGQRALTPNMNTANMTVSSNQANPQGYGTLDPKFIQTESIIKY